jgi:hypothetical protein
LSFIRKIKKRFKQLKRFLLLPGDAGQQFNMVGTLKRPE